LNRGDVITGGTSGATAVVVSTEYNPDTDQYSVYVLNVSGSFSSAGVGETITGSVSGAQGRFQSLTTKSLGDSIVTNFSGEAQMLFNIPNTEAVRFRTGTREFKLLDVPSPTGDFTSRGRANYRAEGILETRQQTVHAVRNAELVQEAVADNRVIVQTAQRVVSDSGWYDPLAQSFLIESRGGAFLSKVDVFFATKDERIPVTMELREMVNGYPGKRVLPFSRVTLNASDVLLSANRVTLDGVSLPTFDTATTFTFPSPVYVQDNTEYCIVLLSDSNNYKVWISQLGEAVPGTSLTISEQPYLGSLFKSQNASTWTADQTQDLKFRIYRCKFDTQVIGNVEFVNDVNPLQTLDYDPLETRSGQTKVRVWQRNHGMTAGSRVTLSTSSTESTYNGIPSAELFTTREISDVDLDSYTITVATSATASGYIGGTTIRATRNYQFDSINPNVQVQTFSETTVNFGVKAVSGMSVDSTTQVPYVADSGFSGVLANENNYFSSPKMVSSELNENQFQSGNKSLTMNVVMSTSNDALSPIIDTHRTSAILVNNKVNNPLETNINVGGLDENVILSANTTVAFSGNTITSTNSTVRGIFKTVNVGKFLTISGASNAGNNGSFLVSGVSDNGTTGIVTLAKSFITAAAGTAITLTQKERFVDEIAPVESSGYSKYVTKKINLAMESTFIRVRCAANIPAEAELEVYYKAAKASSTDSFDTLNYTKIEADSPIARFDNETGVFVDCGFSAEGLAAFDVFQVKLVLKSTNSSQVPKVKDLRIIAAA
jgi:hypothetical protein